MTRRIVIVIFATLCVAVCGLWIRSYWISDLWFFHLGPREHRVWTRRGRVAVETTNPIQSAGDLMHTSIEIDDVSVWIADDFLRTQFGTRPLRMFDGARTVIPGSLFTQPITKTAIVFPLWSLAAAFAILPTWYALRATRSRRRSTQGFCAQCGYDLRASPDRCPECGTTPRSY
jgi:hypothetical protein